MNLKNGLVAETWSQTDRRTDMPSTQSVLFSLHKECAILEQIRLSYNCTLLISWNKCHKNTRITRSHSVQGQQVES